MLSLHGCVISIDANSGVVVSGPSHFKQLSHPGLPLSGVGFSFTNRGGWTSVVFSRPNASAHTDDMHFRPPKAGCCITGKDWSPVAILPSFMGIKFQLGTGQPSEMLRFPDNVGPQGGTRLGPDSLDLRENGVCLY